MFEGNFVTMIDTPGNVGPIIATFDIQPRNVGRIPGYTYRRITWSWHHRTYEIRSSWIPETKLDLFRDATTARVFFRDRPDLTYRDCAEKYQRTEVHFEIYESGAWTKVWAHVFEYSELPALRSAFLSSFIECVNFPWEITLPEAAHEV